MLKNRHSGKLRSGCELCWTAAKGSIWKSSAGKNKCETRIIQSKHPISARHWAWCWSNTATEAKSGLKELEPENSQIHTKPGSPLLWPRDARQGPPLSSAVGTPALGFLYGTGRENAPHEMPDSPKEALLVLPGRDLSSGATLGLE